MNVYSSLWYKFLYFSVVNDMRMESIRNRITAKLKEKGGSVELDLNDYSLNKHLTKEEVEEELKKEKEKEREILKRFVTKRPEAFQSLTLPLPGHHFPTYGTYDIQQHVFSPLYLDSVSFPVGTVITHDDRFVRLVANFGMGDGTTPGSGRNMATLLNKRTNQLGLIHRGMIQWMASSPAALMLKIMDLRYVFATEDGAKQYMIENKAQLTEGQRILKKQEDGTVIKELGTQFMCIGGSKSIKVNDKDISSYAFIFRVGRIIVKFFVAQGPESPTRLQPSLMTALGKMAAAKAALFKFPPSSVIHDILKRNEEDYLFLTQGAEKARTRDEERLTGEEIIKMHVEHVFCGDNRELSKLPKPKL